jgi:hypothetical protein
VAGVFRCQGCKIEVLLEYSPYSELELIVVPAELAVDFAPVIGRRLPNGRALVRWADYKTKGLV